LYSGMAYNTVKAIAGYKLSCNLLFRGGIMSFYILHPKEIEIVRKQKNAIVVDLRERTEYQKYHYKNAVCLPYCEGENWLNYFCKGKVYILYCDYGNISLLVSRKLAQRGITSYTVIGGAKELWRYTP